MDLVYGYYMEPGLLHKQASQPDGTFFLSPLENKVFPDSLPYDIHRISKGSFFSNILHLSDSFTLSLELLQTQGALQTVKYLPPSSSPSTRMQRDERCKTKR